MAPCRLYIATSKTSGKSYVGITVQKLAQRWAGHVCDARRKSNCKLHRAINKYGPADFELIELYCYASREEAAVAEMLLIASLDLVSCGYNISLGGDAPFRGRPHTAEQRAKISAALKGRRKSPEHNRKVGDALRGIKKSVEHCAALSEAQMRYRDRLHTARQLRV